MPPARSLLDIVLTCYAPDDVKAKVDQLFQTAWSEPELYRAIISAIRELEERLPDSPRTVEQLATEVFRLRKFRSIKLEDIQKAAVVIANASQGVVTINGSALIFNASLDEIERRLTGLTKQPGQPRRESNFREGPNTGISSASS